MRTDLLLFTARSVLFGSRAPARPPDCPSARSKELCVSIRHFFANGAAIACLVFTIPTRRSNSTSTSVPCWGFGRWVCPLSRSFYVKLCLPKCRTSDMRRALATRWPWPWPWPNIRTATAAPCLYCYIRAQAEVRPQATRQGQGALKKEEKKGEKEKSEKRRTSTSDAPAHHHHGRVRTPYTLHCTPGERSVLVMGCVFASCWRIGVLQPSYR
jgi:hypothetical protein